MWPALLFSNKDLFFASLPEHSEHLFLNNERTAEPVIAYNEPVIDQPNALILLGGVFLFGFAFLLTGTLTQRSFFPSAKTMQTFFGPEKMTSEPLLLEEDLEVGKLHEQFEHAPLGEHEHAGKLQEGWETKLQSSMGPGGPCRRDGSAERRGRRVLAEGAAEPSC